MRLTREGIKDREKWLASGIGLPEFDYESVKDKTKESPVWIHFGAGNIFRALQAPAMQKLLDEGLFDRGLVVCEGFDYEIIDKAYDPYENLSLLMTLGSDGNIRKKVIGSVMESCVLDGSAGKDYGRLKEIFSSPSLEMISFTITEKGYSLRGADGEYTKSVAHDISAGPEKAESYIGKVAALLYHRFKNGAFPVACISMDNCSGNGDLLKKAITEIADGWCGNGCADAGFKEYLNDGTKISFPWTMIDKITPRPDENILKELEDMGVEGLEITVTDKHTCTSGFVNTEETEYLVIEDDFPAGRPPLEKAGFYFTDRETVKKAESMKVTTCLNPVHTSLAVFGCLLGFTKISDEMKDLLAACSIAISRAGSNAICELLALKKPNLLIPLSAKASRGDQILNARSFEKQGFSAVMEEEEITPDKLVEAVNAVYENRAVYAGAMEKSSSTDAIGVITGLLEELTNAK